MNKSMAEKISELRKARSLTQEQLGKQLGVTGQAISKWENAESMPDIMQLPRLCEIFGVTADALLEVPLSAQKDGCLSALSAYAKEAGRVRASFESLCTCTCAVDDHMDKGSVYQGYDGISICTKNGMGFVINSQDLIQMVLNTDDKSIQTLCQLLSDESVMNVIRAMDFCDGMTEDQIALKQNIPVEHVHDILFQLLKRGFCECDEHDRYTFGPAIYIVVFTLCGIFLSSAEGQRQMNSFSACFTKK
ncbi:MAG: helix-turn-helix transcriptional regulator [Clostridiales bacterium]|nr:helix-turn-helix transcriptional regulator [Clostridiales bacterium]